MPIVTPTVMPDTGQVFVTSDWTDSPQTNSVALFRMDAATFFGYAFGQFYDSFEGSVSNYNASLCSIVATTGTRLSGQRALQITTAGASASQSTVRPNFATSTQVAPGVNYTATFYLYSATGFPAIHASIDWFNSSGGFISGTPSPNLPLAPGQWTQFTTTGIPPAGAFSGEPGPTIINPPDGTVIIFDDLSFAPTATPLSLIDPNWFAGHSSAYPAGLVRPHTSVETTYGWGQNLNGNVVAWVDTEIPLDTPVVYVAVDTATGAFAFSATATLASSGRFWLRNPRRPADDIPVTLVNPSASDCLPHTGVYFSSMGPEDFATQSTRQQIDGARNASIAARPRQGASSVLTLVTRTFADRDLLRDQAATGEPHLFQGSDVYGIPDRYMDVSDLNDTRGLSDHKRQWRVAALTFAEADRPVGLQYGTRGARWMDVAPVINYYNDLANYTTLSLLQGAADPPVSWLRSWDGAKGTFASWTAAGANNRTWTQLVMGQ